MTTIEQILYCKFHKIKGILYEFDNITSQYGGNKTSQTPYSPIRKDDMCLADYLASLETKTNVRSKIHNS